MKFLTKFSRLTLGSLFSLSLASIALAQTFSDIKGNVYNPEIEKATELKIITGFPNNTFRPNQSVTREQAVSMIIDAIQTIEPIDINEEPKSSVRPYLDVDKDRWSYPKIKWFQWNIDPQGSLTGNFRPTDEITRTELVGFLRTAAEFLKIQMGKSSYLTPMTEEIKFSDVSGYDLQLTIQMSAYCDIASPVNEKGSKFAPKKSASRAYTAAAIVRMLDCIQKDPK